MASRKAVRQWPVEVPLDGAPAGNAAVVEAYRRWLTRTEVPLLLLFGGDGVAIKEAEVALCRRPIPTPSVPRCRSGSRGCERADGERLTMSIVTVSRRVSAPVGKVWAAVSDFGGVHQYAAGVKSSPIIEGKPASGVRSQRACAMYDGNSVSERVTESIENTSRSRWSTSSSTARSASPWTC